MKSGELELLQLIKNSLSIFTSCIPPKQFAVNIGVEEQDDCAAIDIGQDNYLVVGTDFIRGPGFKLFKKGIMNYFDCGYYLIMANISDIAAMAAKPIGLTTVLRYTNQMTEIDFLDSIEGMRDAALECDCPIIGGDIGGYDKPVYSACAFGVVKKSSILRRKGIQVGDKICVTKHIGVAATALSYFLYLRDKGFSLTSFEEDFLSNSWKRPSPELKAAKVLREHDFASGGMDISDGLTASIMTLGKINNLGILLEEGQIPLNEVTLRVAKFLEVNHLELAFGASVDFSIIFGLNPSRIEECEKIFNKNGLHFWIIGEAIPPEQGYLIRRIKGNIDNIPGKPWDQIGDGVTRAK